MKLSWILTCLNPTEEPVWGVGCSEGLVTVSESLFGLFFRSRNFDHQSSELVSFLLYKFFKFSSLSLSSPSLSVSESLSLYCCVHLMTFSWISLIFLGVLLQNWSLLMFALIYLWFVRLFHFQWHFLSFFFFFLF